MVHDSAEVANTGQLHETPIDEKEALELYVGRKYEDYKKKWAIGRNGKPTLISLNLGGLFGTFCWSAGRAMYVYASFFFIFILFTDLLYLTTGYPLWEDTAYAIVPLVIYGVFGNYNYHHFATQKVKKMMAEHRTREDFIKAGGFKWGRFFAFMGLLIAYFGLSNILFY
ncbi:hypothetical protein [Alkalicoccobacillus gibsonii]|uniref:hypothetical protein n=1 Tax=Alkalicoccobacillus gibsonii TaxID=79881 RepID=UPI00193304EA|nr:hypothetical protein [Alkalicoccobacillus gibsonii]MBM0065605.1 hypothetical protein [Alkalicoccobacillus gibsonii]